MMKCDLLPKVDRSTVTYQCECCPHPKLPSDDKITNLLDLTYSGICENRSIETRGGKRYFITFIDGYSKYTRVSYKN